MRSVNTSEKDKVVQKSIELENIEQSMEQHPEWGSVAAAGTGGHSVSRWRLRWRRIVLPAEVGRPVPAESRS